MLCSSDINILLSALAITTLFHVHLSHSTAVNVNHRRLLHQPLFTSISEPPSPQPQPNYPKYPFSSTPPQGDDTSTTTTQNIPFFFPFFPSPPPPPPAPASVDSAAVTFPANISSLVTLPTDSSNKNRISLSSYMVKLVSVIVSLSFLLILVTASLVFFLRHHKHHHPYHRQRLNLHSTDNLDDTRDVCSSSATKKQGARKLSDGTKTVNQVDTTEKATVFVAVGSPELHPLPPLTALPPRHHRNTTTSATSNNQRSGSTSFSASASLKNDINEGKQKQYPKKENELCSPRTTPGSSTRNITNTNVHKDDVFDHKGGSFMSQSFNSQTLSGFHHYNDPLSPSSASIEESAKSPDCPFLTTTICHPPPPPYPRAFAPFTPTFTDDASTLACSTKTSSCFSVNPVPPENDPPELAPPLWSKVSAGHYDEMKAKPNLKPSPWDKVKRVSSERPMVWDHFKKSNSFQFDEEMMETLFMMSSSNTNTKDSAKRETIHETKQETRILDPNKSRNIAILLRALNVSIDEVFKALIEGNTDGLDSELLESLLKMAPTEEEEQKLKELKDDDDSLVKNGISDTLLKPVLEIPFAFKRIDAMLYVANFESEIEHLKTLFDTLESACKELKTSRMFRKLLEATLNSGNHINIRSNRGEACGFKLDALLTLIHVKGSDGKTTLLHFVVQEIAQVEGSRLFKIADNNQQLSLQDEIELRKLGLQVVSRLGGELTNVKKAASLDRDILVNDVTKLCSGIGKVREVVKLYEKLASNVKDTRFSDNMNEFLKRAEAEIVRVQAKEGISLSMVKGLTEYFHGDSGKEEAHQLRIFTIVRDFLSALDQVCKDIGKNNERIMMNSAHQNQKPTNPNLYQVFPSFDEKQQCSSSDNDSSSSSY